jgi:transposase
MVRCFAPWRFRRKPAAARGAFSSLVTIYEGGTRGSAARLGGVGLQMLRDWVLRFNAKGPDGLVDGKSTGRPPLLDDEQRLALGAMVEAGPIPRSTRSRAGG